MQINDYWAYIAIETLILISGLCLYLYIANCRLRIRRPGNPENTDSGTLEIDNYAALLQKEILKTEAKLAHMANSECTDPQLIKTVETRLRFLRTERKAINNSGPDDSGFWVSISEALPVFLPVEKSALHEPEDDQSDLIDTLQTRIQAYETRISNLESFKDKFFELKEMYAGTVDLNQRLHTEVEKALPEDEQSPELKETLKKLKDENTLLAEKLDHVAHEFHNIAHEADAVTNGPSGFINTSANITSSLGNIGDGIERVKEVIATQKQKIIELNEFVSTLQVEVKGIDKLKDALSQLQTAHDELNIVMSIFQEENAFLQEQISALLKQELEDQNKYKLKIREMQQESNEQLKKHIELEKKYATMEREYLSSYEENQRLKS